MSKTVADSMLPRSKFIWCLHCEYVDLRQAWLENNGHCTRKNCSGGLLDGWSWHQVRKPNNYPVIPELNKPYSLYR